MNHHILASATFLVAVLLSLSPVNAADKEKIQSAVDRGIKHLRGLQAADGSWPAHRVGGTALAGLTLLECEVGPTDPAIKNAAQYLRKSWTDVNDEYTTYAISLAILFFDRLGDPVDTPVIQALGVRLLAGQNAAGGWTYMCPPLDEDDLRQLRAMVEHQVELKTKKELPKPEAKTPDQKRMLPGEIRQILGRLEQKGIPAVARLEQELGGGGGDNSNTQFAILALWAARRHGIPVENALARAENRFRKSQNGDGGWGYTPGGMKGLVDFSGSTGSMTCAGLLGLAAGLGSAREATLRTVLDPKKAKTTAAKLLADPTRDLIIHNGLNALSSVIGRPVGEAGGGDSAIGQGDVYYLLWSVERVAVAYSLPTIGKKDWYTWGSDLLLPAQHADGGWKGKFGSDVDTSFALLFLRRVNLSRDLTTFLKGPEEMEIALRGKGVMERKGAGATQPKIEDRGSKNKDRTGEDRSSNLNPRSSKANPPTPPVPPDANAEAARLGAELVKASGARQEQLLDQLKQAKGGAFTAALVTAIDQLDGPLKTKAREALGERLARMTHATLCDKLQDEAPEVRRAAALACAMKEDKESIPSLIMLLEDHQPIVARAANAALKDLTGRDFGPSANATPEARSRAVAAWKEWWEKQDGK